MVAARLFRSDRIICFAFCLAVLGGGIAPCRLIAQDKSEEDTSVATPAVLPQSPDDDVAQEIQTPESSADENRLTGFPTRLPDGRLLEALGIFPGQMIEVIPESYRPVSLDKMKAAIKRWEQASDDQNSSHLRSSDYWIEIDGDTMISRRSSIDIESLRSGSIRRSLGKVNLAIEVSDSRRDIDADGTARLVSRPDGELYAEFEASQASRIRLDFDWQLFGKPTSRGHQFELQIPRTGQTRLVISVPGNLKLISLDGVLRLRPGPPSDAGEISLDSDRRWYELDAGSLSTIRLQTIRADLDRSERSTVVRRCTMEYNVEPSGLFWVQRLELSLPVDSQFPVFRVAGTDVTSIKVNASESVFTTTIVDTAKTDVGVLEVQEISITPSPGVIDVRRPVVKVAILGQSSWDETCDLPVPVWDPARTVNVSVMDEAQLMVARPLSLIGWEMPSGWNQTTRDVSDRFEDHRVTGPPFVLNVRSDPQKDSGEEAVGLWTSAIRSTRSDRNPYAWSRLHLVEEPVFKSSATWLRLQARDASLSGFARVEIEVDPERITPVQVQIQPGWNLKSILLPKSGRVIDLPSIEDSNRGVWLWPEATDLIVESVQEASNGLAAVPGENLNSDSAAVVAGEVASDAQTNRKRSLFVAEVSAERALNVKSNSIDLPPLWLARVNSVSNPVVAAVDPPSDMNWSGEAILDRGRVSADQLSERESRFFAGFGRSTLYFRPGDRQTPSLRLSTPSVEYSVAMSMRVALRKGEMYEEISMRVSAAGRSLENLLVRTADSGALPSYQWAVASGDGSPMTSLPPSLVDKTNDDGSDTYSINVVELDLRTTSLIARRRYPSAKVSIELPSVPGASSSQSEVLIGPEIDIVEKASSIQLIPTPYQAFIPGQSIPATSSPVGMGGESVRSDEPAGEFDRGSTRLRYDSNERVRLTLAPITDSSTPNIVAHQRIRVIASSRGSDRIEALYEVTVAKPLVIDYEPGLQLTSITRNGQVVDLLNVSQLPVVLPVLEGRLSGTSELITLIWERSQFSTGWSRQVRMPQVDVQAAVLRSDRQMVASTDSFIPLSIIKGTRVASWRLRNLNRGDGITGVEVEPGLSVTLVKRNGALAAGWLMAIVVFSAVWFAMRRHVTAVAIWFVFLASLLVLWWSWRFAVIGWLMIPSIAAAILVTSRAWTHKGSTLGTGSNRTPSDETFSEGDRRNQFGDSPSDDESTQLSWASILKIMFVIGSLCFTHEQAWCQSSEPVAILVPVNEEGVRAGEMLYLPKSLQAKLFPGEQQTIVQKASLVSVQYTLSISEASLTRPSPTVSPLLEGPVDQTQIEADFVIRLPLPPTGANEVELPIEAANVTRIELVSDVNRLVRYQPSATGKTVVILPAGQSFRIRVSLRPAVEQTAGWTRFRLKVPVVYMASLNVDSNFDLSVVRVGGDQGRLMSETDLRRWTQPLGPVDELIVDYRVDTDGSGDNDAGSRVLQRRYWISAGRRQVSIDCEVDPPLSIALGETFQFVIRDSQMPLMTSGDWHLVGSELYAPNRRLVTARSVRNNPGPVHLLWTVPIDGWESDSVPGIDNAARDSQLIAAPNQSRLLQPWKQTISIPEVIAAALGENAPAWIAFYCDDSMQLEPSADELTEPLSVDQFLVRWSGYRGRIDRALVAISQMPTPIITRSPSPRSRIDAVHRLHITDQQLRLNYEATVRSQGESTKRYTMSVPAEIELYDVMVDGKKVLTPGVENSVGNSKQRVIRLGDFTGTEPVNIQVVGMASLSSGRRFVPPTYRIQTAERVNYSGSRSGGSPVQEAMIRSERYIVTRDNSCDVDVIDPLFGLPPSDETVDVRNLSQGYLHVATWNLQPEQYERYAEAAAMQADAKSHPDSTKSWGGKLWVRPKSTRINCEQLITLSRDSGRWQVTAQIMFAKKRVPDFVDIEIPKRWCDAIEVSPSETWSQQASTDTSVQLLRVLCEKKETTLGNETNRGNSEEKDKPYVIRLKGYLEQSDDGRIGVPYIKVLGLGRRTTFIRVPGRLVNEPIQWRASAVDATELPSQWTRIQEDALEVTAGQESLSLASQASVSGSVANPSKDMIVYQSLGPNWSVTLAPLPKLGVRALAITQDNIFLPSDQAVFVITHWDLSPGSREAIDVRLPSGAEMLGAWVGEKNAHFRTIPSAGNEGSSKAGTSLKGSVVRVPLALSRLSQIVRVLVRQKASSARAKTKLPELVGVPVTQNWLSVYAAGQNSDAQASIMKSLVDSRIENEPQRLVSLARSVVESVEMAVDLLADRPSGEVASWLAPWVQRYFELSDAAGHVPDLMGLPKSQGPGSDNEGDPQSRVEGKDGNETTYWESLDQRMAIYANQYLPGFAPVEKPMLGVADFDGFQLSSVRSIADANQSLVIDTSTMSDRRLRRLITKALTMLLVLGVLVCCRPLYGYVIPVAVHPAFWLGLLGLFSFCVAPPYVAAALILVAIALPVFPSKARR